MALSVNDPIFFITVQTFADLFDVLVRFGYTVVGPTIDQEAIVYDEIRSIKDLPRGWTDVQQPGSYRIEKRRDDALFGYNVGPHSWKRFLFPPAVILSRAVRGDNGWEFETPKDDPPRYALMGVRACELAAIRIQDRVFLSGPYQDPVYRGRREAALIVAVNCTQAAATCFCTSMDSGPECKSGYDLALTELDDGFVVETGSVRGKEILDKLEKIPATPERLAAAERARQQAVDQIERHVDTQGLSETLLNNLEHSRWDEVAERCLSCTNCTMVCPTCFCTSVEEVSDLADENVERQREWDSCFNPNFSYINGGQVRDSIRSRYRQWLTHKLGSWVQQFGTSGCVGCGRCITWCPVGIDLTEEVKAIQIGGSG